LRERVKIYATDVDEEALAKARHAQYTTKEVENVPPDLLEKYFDRISGRNAFRKDLRRVLIFGRHDLVQDAPISRIDLLICRNILMYFNSEAQAKILARLHFGVKDNGYIFLGKAEMLLTHASLFTPVNLRYRIFKKVAYINFRDRMSIITQTTGVRATNPVQNQVLMRELLLNSSRDPQVLLNNEAELILANQRARAVFNLGQEDLGQPFHNLEMSYRPVDLRSPLARAVAEMNPVTINDVEMHTSAGEVRYFNIQIAPLLETDRRILGVSITFEDFTAHKSLYRQLEHSNQELETAMEELQSTNEELETTNEELQSTIEELETTNEELQSANEELETMNEELQSTNQEMETINDELRRRNQDYNQVNTFLQAILESIGGGVIVVDPELRILMWNRKSEDLWGLRSEEVSGRHLLNLDVGLPVEILAKPVRACLAGSCPERPVVLEARNRRGRDIQCLVSITPFAGDKQRYQGAILVVEEVTSAAKVEGRAAG
jgi:two-component system CheB/CheR fusion protein